MELDYISYQNFLKMNFLAVETEKAKREPTEKEIKQFSDLKF